jgi:hypothetical protein
MEDYLHSTKLPPTNKSTFHWVVNSVLYFRTFSIASDGFPARTLAPLYLFVSQTSSNEHCLKYKTSFSLTEDRKDITYRPCWSLTWLVTAGTRIHNEPRIRSHGNLPWVSAYVWLHRNTPQYINTHIYTYIDRVISVLLQQTQFVTLSVSEYQTTDYSAKAGRR